MPSGKCLQPWRPSKCSLFLFLCFMFLMIIFKKRYEDRKKDHSLTVEFKNEKANETTVSLPETPNNCLWFYLVHRITHLCYSMMLPVWLLIFGKIKKVSYISLFKWNRDGSLSASLIWWVVINFKMGSLDQMSNLRRPTY